MYVELVLVCFLCLISAIQCIDGPQVVTNEGALQGKFMTTKKGKTFNAFLSIPFAKPPVDELRFREPIPADPWEGVRDATADSAVCPQRNPYTRSTVFEGDEDCLYLNVYTPRLPDEGKNPLPVMVWFHGGGWVCGGGTSMWYGPEVLLDKDIVLVVPNFRLGPLGFLSTQDDVVPGNMGLKDQVLALRWIQNNIARFGGDPNSVTIFGESAGGASVHLHMLSPLSRGLFHRGISQSGTALCCWAFAPPEEPRYYTEKLAEAFNCPTDSSQELVNCLRKIDALDIIKKDHLFWDWDFDPMIPFKPMAEHEHPGAFLTEQPIDLIKAGNTADIPWMTGITSSEGALRTAGIFGNPHLLEEFNKDFDKIAPMSLFYKKTAPDVNSVTKQIRKFYFGNDKIDFNHFENLTHLYTDGWFLTAADEAIKLHLLYAKTPVYYYYFDYRGTASFSEIFGDPSRNYGVCHADDLQYLFPVGDGLFPDKKPTESDKRITDIISTMWVNFAYRGKPTLENNEITPTIWTPVISNNMEYLHIKSDDKIEMQENLLQERAEFWLKLPTRIDKVKRPSVDEL